MNSKFYEEREYAKLLNKQKAQRNNSENESESFGGFLAERLFLTWFLLLGLILISYTTSKIVIWLWESVKSVASTINDINHVLFLTVSSSIIFLIGYWLYRFKKRVPLGYGIAEIVFAFTTVFNALDRFTNDFATGVTIISAIYLTVRGFVNFNEGFEKLSAETKKEMRSIRWWMKMTTSPFIIIFKWFSVR